MPVPDKLTICGLPGASSTMVMVPVRSPNAAGVKVTFMLQLELAGSLGPQLPDCANSALAVIELMFRIALPVL